MSWSETIGELLRASVARPATAPPARDVVGRARHGEFDSLADAATFHGVAGYVHRATRDLELIPDHVRRRLEGSRNTTVLRHLKAVGDLRYLDRTFDDAGIPWLLVKGPTLAVPVHGAAELRSYGDLDPIVPAEHLAAALQALEAAGSQITDRNWTLINRELKGEVHLTLPSGTALDLHWHLLNNRGPRSTFQVPMRELFQRARVVDVDGAQVPTPSAADTFVYLALHAMLSGGHRLVWLKDLERLLAQEAAATHDILQVAQRWRALLVVRSAIERFAPTLGLPPQGRELLSVLPPMRTWSTLSRRAWQATPLELEDGSGSLGRIVARSVRGDQRESLAELRRRMVRHLRTGRPSPRTGEERRLDPGDPGSNRYESGGEPMRRAYLDAVAAHSN